MLPLCTFCILLLATPDESNINRGCPLFHTVCFLLWGVGLQTRHFLPSPSVRTARHSECPSLELVAMATEAFASNTFSRPVVQCGRRLFSFWVGSSESEHHQQVCRTRRIRAAGPGECSRLAFPCGEVRHAARGGSVYGGRGALIRSKATLTGGWQKIGDFAGQKESLLKERNHH